MKRGDSKYGGGADADPRQGTLSFGLQRAPSLRVAAQQQQLHAVQAADQGLQAKSGAELAVEAAQTAKEAVDKELDDARKEIAKMQKKLATMKGKCVDAGNQLEQAKERVRHERSDDSSDEPGSRSDDEDECSLSVSSFSSSDDLLGTLASAAGQIGIPGVRDSGNHRPIIASAESTDAADRHASLEFEFDDSGEECEHTAREGAVWDDVLQLANVVASQIHTPKDYGEYYLRMLDGIFWVRRPDPDRVVHENLRNENAASPLPYYVRDLFFFCPRVGYKDWGYKVPCPRCKIKFPIEEHSKEFSTPRAICDVDDSWYHVAERYRCPNAECNATFTCDASVMKALPEPLSEKYPCVLSHRNGMSKELFRNLVDQVSAGVSFQQFHENLVARHKEKFILKQTRYERIVSDHVLHRVGLKLSKPRVVAMDRNFKSVDGYAGRVPGARWFEVQFVHWCTEQMPLWAKLRAQIPCRALHIDHSFKIVKLLCKFEGAQLFDALFTVMASDFKGRPKIRCAVFVQSKSFAEVQEILQSIKETLTANGMGNPVVVWSDMCCDGLGRGGDRSVCCKVWPELGLALKNSGMAPNTDQMPVFAVENFKLHVGEVNINSAIDDLKSRMDVDAVMCVDTEHPVMFLRTRVTENVSVVQIGVRIAGVLEVHVCQLWQRKGNAQSATQLPMQLKTLLEDSRHVKVGVSIGEDAKKLQKQFGVHMTNVQELAVIAQQRGIGNGQRSLGLETLTALILKQKLLKDDRVRCSDWAGCPLSAEQQAYAAADVASGLLVFETMQSVDVTDGVVRLHHVHMMPVLQEQIELCSHLTGRRVVAVVTVLSIGNTKAPKWRPQSSLANVCKTRATVRVDEARAASYQPFYNVESRSITDWCNNSEPLLVDIMQLQRRMGAAVADAANEAAPDAPCPTRVLKDHFHAMKTLIEDGCPAHHPLIHVFITRIRDAMLMPNPEDLSRIRAAYIAHDMNFEEEYQYHFDEMVKYMRRSAPQPAELESRLNVVIMWLVSFQEGFDMYNCNGQRLKKCVERMLCHVRLGCLSDPHDIALYWSDGVGRFGLTKWRTSRGTNCTEGGLHRHILSKFPSKNLSLRASICFLEFFIHMFNMRACDWHPGHFRPDLYAMLRLYHGNSFGTVIYPNIPSGGEYTAVDAIQSIVPLGARGTVTADTVKHYHPQIAYIAMQLQVPFPQIGSFNAREAGLFKREVQKFTYGARRPDWTALAVHWNTTLLNEDNSASAALVHAKSAAHLEHYYDQVYLPAAEKRCILEPYQVELEQVLRTLRPIAIAGANGAPEAAQMQDAARSHIQESNFASVTVGIPLLRAAPNNSTPPKRRKPSVYKVCRKCHLLPPLCAGNCVPYLCTAWNLFQINNAKRGWNKATMAAKYTEMLSTSQHDTQ